MQLLRPRALPPGGTIGICSPAGPIDPACLEWGIAWLEDAGFHVRCGRHVGERLGYLAGSDSQRLEDFVELVRDPEVHAILYSRGGYGTARWLTQLDISLLRKTRKLIIGHSDATILSLYLCQQAGLASIHGPMLQRNDLSEAAKVRVLDMATGASGALAPLDGTPVSSGCATAPLIGGNLTMITSSLGTPWEIQTAGCILFLEDIAEQPYAIDRQLRQLAAAGKLDRVAGVALGQFVNCESTRYPERNVDDVLAEVLGAECRGPIVRDLPFGHVADNRALAVGVPALLDGDAGRLALCEPAVETSPG